MSDSATKQLAVTLIIVGAAPLVASKTWIIPSPFVFVVVLVATAVVGAMFLARRRQQRRRKQSSLSRFDESSASSVRILRRMKELSSSPQPSLPTPTPTNEHDAHLPPTKKEDGVELRLGPTIRCLEELSRRCEAAAALQSRQSGAAKKGLKIHNGDESGALVKRSVTDGNSSTGTEGECTTNDGGDDDESRKNLALTCLEAAYLAIETFPDDDTALSAAFGVLALVAGDSNVASKSGKQRYSPQTPIEAMKRSLATVKNNDDPPESEERLSAEVQRKACLWIGAAASSPSNTGADAVVAAGGLDAALDAVDWYRFHSGVCGWGLWAIFNLCYDDEGRKREFRKKNGVQTVCRIMKSVTDSVEVARHGTAILFDVMRGTSDNVGKDAAQSQMIALNEGLHDILVGAVTRFPKSAEIVMMARQMLVSTGYRG